MTNKEFFMQCWEREAKSTCKAILALPSDMTKLSYQPNQMARTAMQIMGHILPHAKQLAEATESFILSENDEMYTSTAEAASTYEKNSADLINKLKNIDDMTWDTHVVPLMMFGNKIYEGPMGSMFWTLLFDTIHHRGQLSTYYRAMGVRNPSIYGPTAEDMAERMATAKN